MGKCAFSGKWSRFCVKFTTKWSTWTAYFLKIITKSNPLRKAAKEKTLQQQEVEDQPIEKLEAFL